MTVPTVPPVFTQPTTEKSYIMSVTHLHPQSAALLYNECHVYIQDGWDKGTPDEMVGKEGFARYFLSDQRWKFRERGEEEWRWVNFHQLAFVPLSGDRVVCTSSDVDSHYRYERYATMSDSDVQDRLITVTSTEWSDQGNEGTKYDQPKAWIIGEVKSRQKPDDTERVRFRACHSPHLLYWLFAESTSLGSNEINFPSSERAANPGRNRLFHDFQLTHARLDHVQSDLNDYKSDFNLVGEMLTHEAQNRDWCDEYDSFVEHFNSKSKIAHIDERRNDYEVEVEMEVTMRIKTHVLTEARNADDAVDNVRDMDESDIDFDLHNHLTNFDYDVVDTCVHEVNDATQR